MTALPYQSMLHESSFIKGDLLNIATTCPSTLALGPGSRSVIWVQGCPFHCTGCISPDWIPFKRSRVISPQDLASELFDNNDVTGLTISGGEPMMQAAGLAELIRFGKQIRDLNVICYSGFTLSQLKKYPIISGVFKLLKSVDVLIDGQYIQALNDNRGMRGSSNQIVHYLSSRLDNVNFDTIPRSAEIQVNDGYSLLVGVPPSGLMQAFDSAVHAAQAKSNRIFSYERP